MWLDGAPLKLGQIETGHVNSPKRSSNHIVSRAGIQKSGYECFGRATKASMLGCDKRPS
jgi:hypothetical protein